MLTGVCGEGGGGRDVRVDQHGGGREGVLGPGESAGEVVVPNNEVLLLLAGRGLEQGGHDDGQLWDKLFVKIDHPAEPPHLKGGDRRREPTNRLNFLLQGGGAGRRDLMSQEGDLVDTKNAFGFVEDHPKPGAYILALI